MTSWWNVLNHLQRKPTPSMSTRLTCLTSNIAVQLDRRKNKTKYIHMACYVLNYTSPRERKLFSPTHFFGISKGAYGHRTPLPMIPCGGRKLGEQALWEMSIFLYRNLTHSRHGMTYDICASHYLGKGDIALLILVSILLYSICPE